MNDLKIIILIIFFLFAIVYDFIRGVTGQGIPRKPGKVIKLEEKFKKLREKSGNFAILDFKPGGYQE